jgi:hypothetical protein
MIVIGLEYEMFIECDYKSGSVRRSTDVINIMKQKESCLSTSKITWIYYVFMLQ